MGSIANRLERDARLGIAETELTAIRVDPSLWRVRVGPGEREVERVVQALSQVGYQEPYDLQWIVLKSPYRLNLVAGGERAGKSYISGEFLTTRVPYGELYWIVADNYELARPEFNYAVDMLGELGAIETTRDISAPKVGKASVRLKTGQYIETKTSDDVRKLAAVAPDGIVMAEAAQCSYEVYLRCVGRLAEKRGWLLMSGTFEGSLSWYAETYQSWIGGLEVDANTEGGFAISLPSWANKYVYPGGRDDPEIQRLEALYSGVEGLFEERCAAVPVPPVGLVFREFRHSIHVSESAEFDSHLPVYLAGDPSGGGNPYSILACQFIPRRTKPSQMRHFDPIDDCHVFDEIYKTDWTDEQMIEAAQKRPWWKNVAGGAIDVEAPDSRKRWMRFGKVLLHSEKVKQLEGIRRLKSFLSYKRDPKAGTVEELPHLLIHPRVRSLPYEFGRYKRKDPVDDDREPKEEPPSDQPNHSIKALWYLLIARFGAVKIGRAPKVTHTWQRPSM